MKTGHEPGSSTKCKRTGSVALAMKCVSAAACVALLATAVDKALAGEILYSFTYTDTFGVTAHGWLESSNVPSDIPGNPGGAGYLVTAGSITVDTPHSASPNDVADGTYPLVLGGPMPQFVVGDTIDNLVYPGNNAGSGTHGGISSPSYIDTNGLEFGYPIGDPANHNAEVFIGIFSLGNGNYALGWSPDGTHPNFNSPSINRNGDPPLPMFPGGGTFILTVPEPSSVALFAVAGVVAVGYRLRRRRA